MSLHGFYGNYDFGKHTGAIDFNKDGKISRKERQESLMHQMRAKLRHMLEKKGFNHFKGLTERPHHSDKMHRPEHRHGGHDRPEFAHHQQMNSVFTHDRKFA